MEVKKKKKKKISKWVWKDKIRDVFCSSSSGVDLKILAGFGLFTKLLSRFKTAL